VINYATRLPPGKEVELLDSGLIRKTERWCEKDNYDFMKSVINHFIKYQDPMVVQVFAFRELGRDRSNHYVYSYDMERCGILSTQERALINTVGDLWDKFQRAACERGAHELESYRRQLPKLYEFLSTVIEQDRYLDLHSGNVMMSPEGNYVLIDLEGFLRYPLNRRSNDWILK